MKKRILSVFISLTVCLSLLPSGVFAKEASEEVPAKGTPAEETTYTINYRVSEECTGWGSVSPESETVKSSDQATVGATAAAEEGYKFVKWINSGGVVISNEELCRPGRPGGGWVDGTTFYAVFEEHRVSYLDENGIENTCTDFEKITPGYIPTGWSDGWYAVEGTVNANSRIEVNGNVNLILTDGCLLKDVYGIHVRPGCSLTIYAQSYDHAGTLSVSSRRNGFSVIGTNNSESGAVITVNGGEIAVATSYSSPGIGGPDSTVTINAGTVSSEIKSAAQAILGNTLTINGGVVTATVPGSTSYGYKPAMEGTDVNISGGTVTATGTGDAGIKGKNITVSGGTIEASSSGNDAIAVTSDGKISVSTDHENPLYVVSDKGSINESPVYGDADITASVTGNSEIHIRSYAPYTVKIETIGNGTLEASTNEAYAGSLITLSITAESGWHFKVWTSDELPGSDNSFTMPDTNVEITAVFEKNETIYYLDENGEQQEISDYNTVGSGDIWNGGWYAAFGTIDLINRVKVNGDVHLILTDGCELTCEAGIQVTTGNTLTIYAQNTGENKGHLSATSTGRDAGIGGNEGEDSGEITFNGGHIEAVGNLGAGIGGGYLGKGTVTINDGLIEASTNNSGAGIGGGGGSAGGGENNNSGTVNIFGGDVTGKSNSGAGIGGGYKAPGTVTIYNGKVKGISKGTGAGIGGGSNGSGTVTIYGGDVTGINTSSYSTRGSGIGGGSKASSNVVVDPETGYEIVVETNDGVQVTGSPFNSKSDITGSVSSLPEVHIFAAKFINRNEDPAQKDSDESKDTNGSSGKNKPGSPKTGDSDNLFLWTMLLLAIGALLGAITCGSKKI